MSTVPVKDANGTIVPLLGLKDASGDWVAGNQLFTGPDLGTQTPVGTGNPLPTVQTPTVVTPNIGDNHAVTISNTAVNAFNPNSITHGAYITNPPTNTISIFVNMVGGAQTTSPANDGTSEEIQPGQTWSAPGPLTTPVSVNATSPVHFTAIRW